MNNELSVTNLEKAFELGMKFQAKAEIACSSARDVKRVLAEPEFARLGVSADTVHALMCKGEAVAHAKREVIRVLSTSLGNRANG